MVKKTTKKEKPEIVDEERLTPPKSADVADEAKLTPPPVSTPSAPKSDLDGDYLRKYEVNPHYKVAYFQLKDKTLPYIPPALGSRAEIMKSKLLAQPKVTMFIPRADRESELVLQPVNLNGYRLDFPKNEYIEMPQQVADELKNSLQQTSSALKRSLIDGDRRAEGALL